MRTWIAIGMLAMLAGCGKGSEDFAVDVSKSPSEVADAIAHLNFGPEQMNLDGFAVTTSRPSKSEIVYTIPTWETPDKASRESVIHLTLEPVGNGTRIHAAVDVPPVPVMMGEPNKVLSEAKVERALKKVLVELSPYDLKELLVAVAISSSVKMQSQMSVAQAEIDNPGSVDWGSKRSGGFSYADGPSDNGGWGKDTHAGRNIGTSSERSRAAGWGATTPD